MAPDITQAFGDNLEQFTREAIVKGQLRVGFDLNADPSGRGELGDKAPQCWQQDVLVPFARRQAAQIAAQLGNLVVC